MELNLAPLDTEFCHTRDKNGVYLTYLDGNKNGTSSSWLWHYGARPCLGHGWDDGDLSSLWMAALEAPQGTSTTASMTWMRSLLSFPSLHISQLLDQATHLLTELHLCICLQRLICNDLEGHFSRHSLCVQPGKWESPYPDNTGLDSPFNKPSPWSTRRGKNTGAYRAIKVAIRCGVDM